MLEINCNKCTNLIDKFSGCEVYGNDPEKACKHCREDLFTNYKPEEESRKKITPGETVWVVERDCDGYATEVTGYLFMAEVSQAVIVTSKIYGLRDFAEVLEYHMEKTREDYETDLSVFPSEDCYSDKEAAIEAIEEELGVEDLQWMN